MLVDSHCHLGDEAFAGDLVEVVERAWTAGLGALVVVGESRRSAALALELASEDGRIGVVAGVHPHDAKSWDASSEPWLRETLATTGVVALGEIGLDYHYDHSPRASQIQVFERQLALAVELGLPAVIHAREADDDIAAVLRNQPQARCVLHSFSSGLGLWRTGLDLGHYLSFSGMVTFKNWQLDTAVRETPLDRLLLETDAPYLAPVPYRGKRNEPAYVEVVARRVAEVRGMALEELISATGGNVQLLFGLPRPAAGRR